MKKLFLLVIVLFAVQVAISQNACNANVPGWGENLGVVSFYTDSVWIIEGNGIRQEWSNAVTATACQKATFDGGLAGNFNADCRTNPEFPGDLFSWCAVYRFGQQLCPYPWRVPTAQDFVNLDLAMGGDGTIRTSGLTETSVGSFVRDNFLNTWGGVFGGRCNPNGSLRGQAWNGSYWSSADSPEGGVRFYFTSSGCVNPNISYSKGFGLLVRCVR